MFRVAVACTFCMVFSNVEACTIEQIVELGKLGYARSQIESSLLCGQGTTGGSCTIEQVVELGKLGYAWRQIEGPTLCGEGTTSGSAPRKVELSRGSAFLGAGYITLGAKYSEYITFTECYDACVIGPR